MTASSLRLPKRSLIAPEKTFMMDAVASAMPSIRPTASTEVPSTATMYMGSRAWISSEEMSMNMETKPSAQTLRGTAPRLGCAGSGEAAWVSAVFVMGVVYQLGIVIEQRLAVAQA